MLWWNLWSGVEDLCFKWQNIEYSFVYHSYNRFYHKLDIVWGVKMYHSYHILIVYLMMGCGIHFQVASSANSTSWTLITAISLATASTRFGPLQCIYTYIIVYVRVHLWANFLNYKIASTHLAAGRQSLMALSLVISIRTWSCNTCDCCRLDRGILSTPSYFVKPQSFYKLCSFNIKSD